MIIDDINVIEFLWIGLLPKTLQAVNNLVFFIAGGDQNGDRESV
jgi:hypothetical protein